MSTLAAGDRQMSALISQARSRVPRIAEAAVERARLTVVPRPPAPGAPGCRSWCWCRCCCSAASSGCCCFNTSMQQASFAATALEHQADALDRPAADAARWSSTRCATRSGSRRRPSRSGMVAADQPGVPPALRRQGARQARPRPPRDDALRITAAARPRSRRCSRRRRASSQVVVPTHVRRTARRRRGRTARRRHRTRARDASR